MSSPATYFGSLKHYEKGGVTIINDDPKNYAFSNVFEVAAKSAPYEKVAVGKNLKYVIEAVRAEGDSPWYETAHDEAVLVMDGELEVHYVKPDAPQAAAGKQGAIKLAGEPKGKKDRARVGEIFNAWAEETGMPLAHLSMTLAASVD